MLAELKKKKKEKKSYQPLPKAHEILHDWPPFPQPEDEGRGGLKNASLQVYYSSTFHFQSRHTFVTKKLLKAQFQGILCMWIKLGLFFPAPRSPHPPPA